VRLTNSQIQANLSMIEARLRSDPETAAEWISIRDALKSCLNEAEKRVVDARAGYWSKEQLATRRNR